MPLTKRRLRLLALGYGGCALFWLSMEDHTLPPVLILGGGLAGIILMRLTWGKLEGQTFSPQQILISSVLMGALWGLGTSVSSAGLMFFKNAWHAHVFLDYPHALIFAVLQRGPVWSAAGGFILLGIALAWLASKRD